MPAAKKNKTTKSRVKKSIFHKLSQKGLIRNVSLSKSQFLIIAAVLGTIGIAGVVASHAGSRPLSDSFDCYADSNGKAPVLRINEFNNNCVKYLQNRLNAANSSSSKLSFARLVEDGDFGPHTQTAVKEYQKVVLGDKTPSGVVDRKMWNKLGAPKKHVAEKHRRKHTTVRDNAVVEPSPINLVTPKISLSANKSSYFNPEVVGHRSYEYCLKWSTNLAHSKIKNIKLYSSKSGAASRSYFFPAGTYYGNGSKCYSSNPHEFFYVTVTAKDSGRTAESSTNVQF